MPWFQQVLLFGNGKNKIPRNFLSSVLILTPFIVISLATSKSDDSQSYASYAVTSNCSNATITSGTIVIQTSNSGRPIVNPANTTYLNLGLPKSNLIIGAENTISAEIAPALIRSCIYSTTQSGSVVSSVYTCVDNLTPSCVVTLTPVL